MATSSATKQPFIAAKFEMDTPSREQLTEQMAMRVYVGGIGDRTQSEEVVPKKACLLSLHKRESETVDVYLHRR